MPLWFLTVLVYIAWNLTGYLEAGLFKDSFLADCAYWTFERIFVVVSFWTLHQYVRTTKWHRYLWLIKTMICIAVLKLIYAILVMTGVLRLNEHWIIMGYFFVIALGYIIVRWERSQRNY